MKQTIKKKELKQFNKTIKVEIEVDQIAQQLLSKFKDDEKHAVIITEAIIGSAVNADNVSYIYNALCGFTNEIDFEIDDPIMCKTKVYSHILNEEEVEEQVHQAIGNAIIKDIDIFSDYKLMIQYEVRERGGTFKTNTKWVSHRDCSKLVTSLELAH